MNITPAIGTFAFVQDTQKQQMLSRMYQLISSRNLEAYFSETNIIKILDSNIIRDFEEKIIMPFSNEYDPTNDELVWTIEKMREIFQNGWEYFYKNFA